MCCTKAATQRTLSSHVFYIARHEAALEAYAKEIGAMRCEGLTHARVDAGVYDA